MHQKMVIHCCSGIKNSGDEAILQAILFTYYQDYQIRIISENGENTEKTVSQFQGYIGSNADTKISVCRNRKEAQQSIRECDIFLLGGGGLLQDETTIYNVSKWLMYYKQALKSGKKVVVYGNSIGPLKYGINRRMVATALRKADLITLRDELSAEELRKIGVSEKVYVTSDPVFSFPFEQWREATAKIPAQKQECGDEKESFPYICMTPRHCYDIHPLIPVSVCNKLHIRSRKNQIKYENYVDKLADGILKINETYKVPVVILPFLYGRDTKVARDILARVNEKNVDVPIQNRMLEKEVSPLEMMEYICESKMLIGMRLHSIIYAILMGTPVVPLIYSDKVRGMVELLGLSDYSLLVDELTQSELLQRIQLVEKQRESVLLLEKQAAENMREREKLNRNLLLKVK